MMIKTTAALLVVLVPATSCRMDNVDQAEPAWSEVHSMSACEDMAKATDAASGVRAFCIPLSPE